MPASHVTVLTALRLGWAVAELRGRLWPRGPRTRSTPLPPQPKDVLPLRSQRLGSASRQEAVASLLSLAKDMELDDAGTLALEVADVPGARDAAAYPRKDAVWSEAATFFLRWDAHLQDELTGRSEALA